MITNIIINLYEFYSKVERQLYMLYRQCQVPTRISYLKGIEKIPENRSVFQNALQLEQRQRNPGRERWYRQQTTASVTVNPACATFLAELCNPITRQAIEQESCSNPLRIQQVLQSKSKKKIFVFGGERHKWGCFWLPLPGPGSQPIGPLLWLKMFSETRPKSESLEPLNDFLAQGLPTWATCTPRGTFAYPKGYI